MNPTVNTASTVIFLFSDMVTKKKTGMGRKKMRKSVAMCSPMAAQVKLMGWQEPYVFSSQILLNGTQTVISLTNPQML